MKERWLAETSFIVVPESHFMNIAGLPMFGSFKVAKEAGKKLCDKERVFILEVKGSWVMWE